MKKLLIVAHENFENSKNNKNLLASLDNLVNIHYLDYALPHYKFNVEKEQILLLEHEEIILQFPIQWFSSPALLKKWLDDVFSYDFAYGNNYKLKDKKLKIVMTAGGHENAYTVEGSNGLTIDQMLVPFKAIAQYVKMNYDGYFVLHNVFQINDEEIKEKTIEYKNFIKN